MIVIKSEEEINKLRIAGNIVYKTHQYLKNYIKPGITTKELNSLAEEFIKNNDATPSFKNHQGFPASICTSVNEQIVHGIPGDYKLKDGDIISIDIGACYRGYHGDSGWTYPVGKISEGKNNLLKLTEEALYTGLNNIKPGKRIGDISNAIETVAKNNNLGIVKELVGHGIGSDVHEDPEIPNYGISGTGPILEVGMVLAIEPMLTLGSPNIVVNEDGWTIESEDYSPSAHFEHTVVVTEDGYEILTGELIENE